MLRNKNPLFPNFLDFKNSSFKPLHNAMDILFKDLRTLGIGSHGLKKAEVLTNRMKIYLGIQTQFDLVEQ